VTDEVREEHRSEQSVGLRISETPMGETSSESITAMEQELQAAKADMETTRMEVESLNSQLSERDSKMGELQTAITEKVALIESQEQELATLRDASAASEGRIAELSDSLVEATTKYRSALASANPSVPASLLTGETIAEIDAALTTAQGVVETVKETLAAASAEMRVPAGAPERTGPDLSSLSPKEKIQYAIRKETE